MKTSTLRQIAMLAASMLFSATSFAVLPSPPTSGPYVTDPQNEYVQDATTDAIGGVNMVLCIMNAMNMSGSGMINAGPYVALIDINKCQSKGGSSNSSSSSSGASAAVNYMTATVDVTRVDNSSPMIANVWMSLTQEGKTQDIYVKLTATSSPAEVPPYGVFRLDYQGRDTTPSHVEQMVGFINSVSGNLKYFESGSNSSNIALSLAAADTNSGSGKLTAANPTPASYTFNYNTAKFRRSDGANDHCFDRQRANADLSVWRYGTYNIADGNRVDQTNPSFQIIGTYGGNSYYGYAGYYGIGFQGLDINSISGVNPISGLTITDQRTGHTSDSFSLSTVGGKLTKWAKVATTLNAINGIPFYVSTDLTSKTSDTTNITGWGNWQLQWVNDTGTAGHFIVTGKQVCGSNNCSLSSLTTATVNTGAFNNQTIYGWSDSFGGNINIPASATDHINTDSLSYFVQSTVIPGSAGEPTTLHCLSNCLDATSVGGANAYTSSATPDPYSTVTANQWGSAASISTTIDYTFGAAGLIQGATPVIITNAAFFSASPNYQYGVSTGRLFDTPLSHADCYSGAPVNTVCEPSDPSTYYTWSTSTDQWNQSMWLTRINGANSGAIVTFDPPQNIQYTVPSGTAYGTWAGKTIQLQFNGFGNLNGVPGSCVDPVTNAVVNCTQNTRYVPAFSIPDAATMTLGTTTLIVKALDAEVRLKDLGDGATVCSALPLPLPGDFTLPTQADTHDVSAAPASTYSVGTKPNVSTPPKVIDGVVQP